MRKVPIIILISVVFCRPAFAFPYFLPFDTLNTPDRAGLVGRGGFYLSGGFYYLDDTGKYYDENGESVRSIYRYRYYFVPVELGYETRFGLYFGAQITAVNGRTNQGWNSGLGDFWIKAKYSLTPNDWFRLGGRLAGKFVNFHRHEEPIITDRASAFDLCLTVDTEPTDFFIAEYALGYRFVGRTDAGYDDYWTNIGGSFYYMSTYMGFPLFNRKLVFKVPFIFNRSTATYTSEFGSTSESASSMFSSGMISTLTIGDTGLSAFTFSFEVPIMGQSVRRDYYFGATFSTVFPSLLLI
jgi:hypothetical protein